jgi:hypothetical protein
MAVETKSAGNVEGQYHAVAFLDAAYRFSHLLDDSHDFVADDRAFLKFRAPVVHVQVAPANSTCRHSENRVARRIQFRLGTIGNRNIANPLIANRFHLQPPE